MIDKLMKKYGYKKTYEGRYGVRYEKYHTIFKFTQYIDICHKENMENIMISYVKFSYVGLKQKQFSIKYKL